jgi:hypothetical protein
MYKFPKCEKNKIKNVDRIWSPCWIYILLFLLLLAKTMKALNDYKIGINLISFDIKKGEIWNKF